MPSRGTGPGAASAKGAAVGSPERRSTATGSHSAAGSAAHSATTTTAADHVSLTATANLEDLAAEVGSPTVTTGPGAFLLGEPSLGPVSPSQFAQDYLSAAGHPFLALMPANSPSPGNFQQHTDGSGQFNGTELGGMPMDMSLGTINDFLQHVAQGGHGAHGTTLGGDGTGHHDDNAMEDLQHHSADGDLGHPQPQQSLEWSNLSIEQQLLLLQQPDFLQTFVGLQHPDSTNAGSGVPQYGQQHLAQQQPMPQLVFPSTMRLPGLQQVTARHPNEQQSSAESAEYNDSRSTGDGSSPFSDVSAAGTTASPKRVSKGRKATPPDSLGHKKSPAGRNSTRSGAVPIPDSGVILDERMDDDRAVGLSPLISPAITPSIDFTRMSLAHNATGLTPLSSPALQPTNPGDPSVRSPSFGPARVSVTAKRSEEVQSLPSPVLAAVPYQVPLPGRRRAGGKGSSPALLPRTTTPSPRLGPSGKMQKPMTPADAFAPTDIHVAMASIGEAAISNQQGYMESFGNSPVFTSGLNSRSGGNKSSPLLVAAVNASAMSMAPLPPPAMGPATPASLMNLGRSGSSPSMTQFIQPSPRTFSPSLGPSEMGMGYHQGPEVNAPLEARRSSHKVAEQKRRDSLRVCFDNLRDLLPEEVVQDEKNPSKVFILKKSSDYIRTLLTRQQQTEHQVRQLKAELNDLKASIRGGGSNAGMLQSPTENRDSGMDMDREMREYEDFKRWKRQFEERERGQSQTREQNDDVTFAKPAPKTGSGSQKQQAEPAGRPTRNTSRARKPPPVEDDEDDEDDMDSEEDEE